jgi:hypothetical protein
MPPLDPDERRRRRALARAHHPDLGGDADAFIAAMTSFGPGGSPPRTAPPGPGDRAAGAAPGPADEVRFVRRPHGLARVPAWWRAYQLRRHLRSHPRVS